MKLIALIGGLLLSAIANAVVIDLELEHPPWATEAVLEFGTCVSGERGKVAYGTTFDIRSVSTRTLRYSMAVEREVLTCIRMSWHALGVELVSPEIFTAVPR